MNQRISRLDKALIFVMRKAEFLIGEIAQKNLRAAPNVFLKFSEIHVQLERLPEAFARFLLAFRAHEQIQRIAMAAKQSGGEVAPEIPG